MKNKVIILLMLACCCLACTPSTLSVEELNDYVLDEDHGLIKQSKLGSTVVSLTYRPTDLLVSQELEGSEVSAAAVDTLRKKYGAYYYFVLSLSRDNKEALHQTTMDEYSDLLNTLSFRMSEFVSMTTAAQDTIPVGDFVLNRTFGMNSSTDVLFVFDKAKTKNADWVQFNLNEFGLAVGNQRFRFDVEDLENIPRVNFSVQ